MALKLSGKCRHMLPENTLSNIQKKTMQKLYNCLACKHESLDPTWCRKIYWSLIFDGEFNKIYSEPVAINTMEIHSLQGCTKCDNSGCYHYVHSVKWNFHTTSSWSPTLLFEVDYWSIECFSVARKITSTCMHVQPEIMMPNLTLDYSQLCNYFVFLLTSRDLTWSEIIFLNLVFQDEYVIIW